MAKRLGPAAVAVLALLSGTVCARQPESVPAATLYADGLRPLPPIESMDSVEQAAYTPSDPLLLPPEQEAVVETAEAVEAPPKLWDGSFELGLNGTEGNSRTLNFRFGFDAKRKTECNVFTIDLDCRKDTSNSVQTASRVFLDWRYEWLFCESPWTLFIHGTDDFDQFRPYDVRVTLDAGVGRRFIDTDWTSFLGRFGAGVEREVGGLNDDYEPELVIGLDFEHKLSERQKFAATIDYMPNIEHFSDCRINSRFDWELLLDEDANLSMKLRVLDRYDSTLAVGKLNDVDYSIVFVWGF